MFTQRYSHAFLKEHLLPRQQWRPFPPANNRPAWEQIASNPSYRGLTQFLIQTAEQQIGVVWPTLPATLYMEFVRTGKMLFQKSYSGLFLRNFPVCILCSSVLEDIIAVDFFEKRLK